MGEKAANRNRIDGAEIVVDLAQFGHIANRRIIERELAAITQLKNGDCGHGLGDRGPVVGGLGVDALMCGCPCFAEEQLRCRLLHVDDSDTASHDSVLREDCVEALRKGLSLCEGRRRSEVETDQQRCEGNGDAARHGP